MKSIFFCLFAVLFSLSAIADTALNNNTIRGEYIIKAKDVFLVARVTLGKKSASMVLRNTSGDLTCAGSYQFIAAQSLLVTDFQNCGQIAVSHRIQLQNQTVESLQANALVPVELMVNGSSQGTLPFTIQKIK